MGDELMQTGNALIGAIPAMERMGVRAVEVRRGFARATVPFEGNGNHVGTMYAGVLFTVAEVLGGLLFIASFDTSRSYPIVKDLGIRFRRPARTEVTSTCTLSEERIATVSAEADRLGKADFVLEAVLTDTEGEEVALSTATYQIRAFGS